jgi:hypothetical protein
MLVTLADVKSFLGESGNTFDSFLTEQINLISDAIEQYCGRKFLTATYKQTYYSKDYKPAPLQLQMYHYPVKTLTSLKQDGVLTVDGFRLHKATGTLISDFRFLNSEDEIEVIYDAGYDQAEIPTPLKNVVYSLVEEKYNRKKSGLSLNFGNDVQRISVAGTMSIDFDYSLNNNDRSNAFGSILGAHLNVVDAYRSDRRIIGSGTLAFVE